MNSEKSSPKRMPPANLDAERAVLGGMLLDTETISDITNILRAEHFYREAHQILFNAIIDLINRGVEVDLLTLKDRLEKDGQLDKVGGMQMLASLTDETSAVSNIEYYAFMVREKATLRELILTAEQIVFDGYAAEGDVKDIVSEAESKIFRLAQTEDVGGPQHIRTVLKPTFETLEQLSKKPELVTGVSTGFEEMDEMTSGLQKGDLVILAGRPSMGKTTLGINIMQYIGSVLKEPCLIFSLEMTNEQLVRRMLCAQAEIDGHRLRTGYIKKAEWPQLARAAVDLSHVPIYIDDSPSLSVLEMRSRARRIKSSEGLSAVMIDYLQLMQSHGTRRVESRQLEISEISRSLKFMAKELDVPVIALSQLSRSTENHPNKRPLLSDLRESGAIEQDADVVLMLYRPEYYEIPEVEIKGQKQPSEGIAELIIAKQRNGPVGSIFLAFRKNLLQFKDIQF